MQKLSVFTDRCSRALLWCGAAGLIAMTLIIGWQVFGRYVLGQSPDWSEQAALVLMIWYVSLASAAGVREGFHIRIVAFENMMPPKIRYMLGLMQNGVIAICGVVMCIWGVQLVIETWAHAVPTLPLTRGMAYLVVPFSGALISLFATEHVLVLRRSASTAAPLNVKDSA